MTEPTGHISEWISALRSRGCKPQREGNGWRASCPTNAHENGNRKNPALHIEEAEGSKVLAHCHAGCDFEDIRAALGLDPRQSNGSTWTPRAMERSAPAQAPAKAWETPPVENTVTNRFPYHTAEGAVLVTIARRDGPDGKKVGHPWREPKGVEAPPGGYPLYRLLSLLANADKPLLVVEGEATAECAHHLFGDRYEATSAIGGSGSAAHSDWTPARGRAVYIWPDADTAGAKHADEVARLCHEVGAAAVLCVRTDDLPDGWDLADTIPDWLDIEARLEDAVSVPPPTVAAAGGDPLPFAERHDWSKLVSILPERSDWSVAPPHREWLIEGWLSWGRIALLSGRGGAGKSKLAIQLGHAIAAESVGQDGTRQWFEGGPEINIGEEHVAFATWEDDADEIMRRMLDHPAYAHGDATAALSANLADRFHVFDLAGQGPLWEQSDRGHGRLTETGMALRLRCEALGARLLVIDPLAAAYADSEINRGAVRAFIGSWDAWGREADCTVFIVGHPPKGNAGDDARYSGSTDWRNGVRSFLFLERMDGMQDRANLIADKTSYGPRPKDIALENWVWWKMLPWSETPKGTAEAEREDHIIEQLQAEQPRSQRDIIREVGGKTQAVRRTLQRMVEDGTLIQESKGKSFQYTLARTP